MGTEKRERQKANRQQKYEQQAKEQQRQKLTRRVIIGVGAVIGVLALVLFLAWAFGGDGDDNDPPATSTTTAAADTTIAPSTTVGGSTTTVALQPFAYGTGACPPEQVTEPVRSFDDAPQLCIDPAASYTARFVTDQGDIVVDLAAADVPGTVNNFVTLARYGYYDDTRIFRADASIGILQGGGFSNTEDPGYEIPDEAAGFTYRPGQLAMARTQAPNSAGGQWFFTVTDAAAALDAQGTYVVFGEITEGLDVAEAMLALAPTDGGDTPTEEIILERVEITETPAS